MIMRLKNKILSAFMIIAAAATLITASAMAAPSVSFAPETVEVKPGETFTVTLNTAENPGFCTLGMIVTGSNDTFTLTNVADGGLYGTAVHGNNMNVAEYYLTWYYSDLFEEETTVNGEIVTLTYKVNDNVVDGTYKIKVKPYEDASYNMNEDFINFGEKELSVVVKSTPTPTTKAYFAATLTWGIKAKANTGVEFIFDGADNTAKVPFGTVTFEDNTEVNVGLEVTDIPENTTLTLTDVDWYE